MFHSSKFESCILFFSLNNENSNLEFEIVETIYRSKASFNNFNNNFQNLNWFIELNRMLTSIDNKLIEDTRLKNYEQIALNIKHMQIMNADIEITELEESKSESNQYWQKSNQESAWKKPEFYNMKEITKNKTKSDIIKLIRNELGVKNNKRQAWDEIIESVSKITLDDSLQKDRKLLICLIILLLFNIYWYTRLLKMIRLIMNKFVQFLQSIH